MHASCHQVFLFLQGNSPKEIHAVQTEILNCLVSGRAKDLSAPPYMSNAIMTETLVCYLAGRAKDLSAPI